MSPVTSVPTWFILSVVTSHGFLWLTKQTYKTLSVGHNKGIFVCEDPSVLRKEGVNLPKLDTTEQRTLE